MLPRNGHFPLIALCSLQNRLESIFMTSKLQKRGAAKIRITYKGHIADMRLPDLRSCTMPAVCIQLPVSLHVFGNAQNCMDKL